MKEGRLVFDFKDQSLTLSTCKSYGFKRSLVYTTRAFSSLFCSQLNAEMCTEILCRTLKTAHRELRGTVFQQVSISEIVMITIGKKILLTWKTVLM